MGREPLAAYLKGALVEDEAKGKTVLTCHPHSEASLYSHEFLRITDDELKRPKFSVHFHNGERSNMFSRKYCIVISFGVWPPLTDEKSMRVSFNLLDWRVNIEKDALDGDGGPRDDCNQDFG
ncbi:Serine protease [Phytophthora megakarya]|uniref:Serine protease n=1 Tax=Phytophthora megakarya TaxID=4795 RepID=A0A225UXC3_9STRA|nr:Serine protease [Phytophthora megakarya]